MQSTIEFCYAGIEKIIIEHAGKNSYMRESPHFWYVVARVRTDLQVGGAPVSNGRSDFNFPGAFFIRTRQGWVFVSERAFPELIDSLMKVFHLTPELS